MRRTKNGKLAEPNVAISQENILMSIVPSPELGEKLAELSQKIRDLKKVNLPQFTEEISKIIEDNKENFLTPDRDVREVVKNLLVSTLETEVVNMVRPLFVEVKRAQGYAIYNRGQHEIKEGGVDKELLKQKLTKALASVGEDGFDIGLMNLNRYMKTHLRRLDAELGV